MYENNYIRDFHWVGIASKSGLHTRAVFGEKGMGVVPSWHMRQLKYAIAVLLISKHAYVKPAHPRLRCSRLEDSLRRRQQKRHLSSKVRKT